MEYFIYHASLFKFILHYLKYKDKSIVIIVTVITVIVICYNSSI